MTTLGWICLGLLPVLALAAALAMRWVDRLAEEPAARYIGRAHVPSQLELELAQAVGAAQDLYDFYRVTGWLPGERDYRNHPMGDTR